VDHNVPTTDRTGLIDVETFIEETASRTQVMQLEQNVANLKENFERLHSAIIGKISEYDQNIRSSFLGNLA
jgi:hypothetical protein